MDPKREGGNSMVFAQLPHWVSMVSNFIAALAAVLTAYIAWHVAKQLEPLVNQAKKEVQAAKEEIFQIKLEKEELGRTKEDLKISIEQSKINQKILSIEINEKSKRVEDFSLKNTELQKNIEEKEQKLKKINYDISSLLKEVENQNKTKEAIELAYESIAKEAIALRHKVVFEYARSFLRKSAIIWASKRLELRSSDMPPSDGRLNWPFDSAPQGALSNLAAGYCIEGNHEILVYSDLWGVKNEFFHSILKSVENSSLDEADRIALSERMSGLVHKIAEELDPIFSDSLGIIYINKSLCQGRADNETLDSIMSFSSAVDKVLVENSPTLSEKQIRYMNSLRDR